MLRATLTASLLFAGSVTDEDIAPGPEGFAADVLPFLEANCVRCHGPLKSKARVTLHDLDGDLSAGADPERWERILEMLESGEMPPEDEAVRPSSAERAAVASWIRAGQRAFLEGERDADAAPVARRLTNLEYENTMGDLLGFRLKLSENLPADPVKPYTFHNTAEAMLLGPEQVVRYLENARRALASAIVDPGEPEVHRTRTDWQAHDVSRGMGADEIGVYGNRRNTPSWGFGLKSWPRTGEYRIRMQAAAILPPGTGALPLRLVMGYTLAENSSMLQMEPVGTATLRNHLGDPQVFEFTGRIENHPARPGRNVGDGKTSPPTMVITPQNLYDNGRLGDRLNPLAMPRAVVEWIEFEAPVTDVWPPAHHTRILFDSPLRESDPDAYARAVLERFLSRAFRRPASAEEVDTYAQLHALLLPELGTLEATLRETLAMALISPQFLYHTVAADGVATRHDELASRLAYFLWRSMPDAELLRLARDGTLADDEVLAAQVRRLLADERCGAFAFDFTTQWLSLAKLHAVKVNTSLFPRFLYLVERGERAGTEVPYRPTIRDHMHAETVGFVAELIRRNAPVLAIVDSDFAYLNQPLAAHYGVDGVEGHALRPVPLEPGSRLGGLLAQGSVLIANSTGSAPHPIYRAVWLREAILGDDVKPPPAEVPALVDSAGDAAESAATIKDLLHAHRQQESCNDCHVRLDPWGIPFERYNAIGSYQPRVPANGVRVSRFDRGTHGDLAGYAAYLDSIHTVEVQAEARVPNGPVVDGLDELKAHLLSARGHDVARNVVRRLLAFGLGRELTFRDRAAVEALLGRTVERGHRLEDVIVAICQSPTFKGLEQ